MAATSTSTRPPFAAGALAAVQFVVTCLACVVLLGNGAVDGQLGTDDVVVAIGAALVGAGVAGSTWAGIRIAFPIQLLLAVGLGIAAVLLVGGTVRTAGVIAAVGWLGALIIPGTRRWFMRRDPATAAAA